MVFSSLLIAQVPRVTFQYDAAGIPKSKIIEIKHLTAHLKIDPYIPLVDATAEFNFYTYKAGTDSFYFSISELNFSETKINNSEVPFKVKGNKIWVYPTAKLQPHKNYAVKFYYTAQPTSGLNFIGWNDPQKIKRKQVWAHRPNHWLPYLPGRITVDMFVTFDKNYKVFSNGVRQSEIDNADGTKTWHYKMFKNHPFFSTALVIGDYKYKSFKTKRGLPLEYWYYPDREKYFETTYQYSKKMFDFLENEIGVNYPYELYRQAPVEDYLYGAMETTTSTIYADFMYIDPHAYWMRNYINVNAHELTHQWFGNCIAHRTNNVWLTEGFATYYAKIFEKSIFGDDYYQVERNKERNAAIKAAKRNNNPVGESSGGTARFYQKGSLILDMLRYVLGDADFKTSIKNYMTKYKFGYAEINDLILSIYETTGQSLYWFFDEWLYRGGEPNYNVHYSANKNMNGNQFTQVSVEQIQKTNDLVKLFKMPIEFEVHYTDGTFDKVQKMIEKKYSEVIIPNRQKKKIAFVLFDPNRQILKKVKFKRNYNELSLQALNAPNMIDRYDALIELRKTSFDKKENLLYRIYKHENFHLIKNEIIAQLKNDSSTKTITLLKSAINDKNPLVRNAVLKNISDVPVSLKLDYEKLLDDYSYSNIELALENLINSFPKEADKYLNETKNDVGWRGMNIKIKWLQLQVQQGQKKYIKNLKDYTTHSYEFETRINAIKSLKALNYFDDETAGNIIKAFFYWNYKLVRVAKDALIYFNQQTIYAKIMKRYIKSNNFEKSKLERLNKLL